MIADSELTRTFESKNHIKIKTNRHWVMENGCIWEGILLMNTCWVSQLVFYQVLAIKERIESLYFPERK